MMIAAQHVSSGDLKRQRNPWTTFMFISMAIIIETAVCWLVAAGNFFVPLCW